MPRALSEYDRHLLEEGAPSRASNKLGAHLSQREERPGVQFSVWALRARSVSLAGDFHTWNRRVNPMQPSSTETFLPDVGQGTLYKYPVESSCGGYKVDKADAYGFASGIGPQTASYVGISSSTNLATPREARRKI